MTSKFIQIFRLNEHQLFLSVACKPPSALQICLPHGDDSLIMSGYPLIHFQPFYHSTILKYLSSVNLLSTLFQDMVSVPLQIEMQRVIVYKR